MYENLQNARIFTLFLPEKLSTYPNLYDICPEINKIPEFYTIFARKMPEFYVIIARKIFPDFFFWGGDVPHISYAYAYPISDIAHSDWLSHAAHE